MRETARTVRRAGTGNGTPRRHRASPRPNQPRCASGARSLILVSRRRGLYQASIHSKIACDSWTFVSHRWVSRTSRYIVDQNDSIIALSTEATRPIEPGSLAWRSRCPNAQDVYCPGCHDRSCPAAVAVVNTPSAGHRRPSWCVCGRRSTSPQSSANTHPASRSSAPCLRWCSVR